MLLTEFLEAKISDLGVARAMTNSDTCQYPTPGTIAFMPPECISTTPVYGPPMDVFSFAGIVLHTFSEEWPTPEDQVKYDPQTKTFVIRTESERRQQYLEKMDKEAESLVPLIKSCLEYVPTDRPTIEIISEKTKQSKDAYIKKIALPHDNIIQQQLEQFQKTVDKRDKEIQQLQTDKDKLQAEIERLMQLVQVREIVSNCMFFY